MNPEPQPSGDTSGGGVGLSDAARAWVNATEGLRDEERALLTRGVEAIDIAERWARINEQGRLTTLGPMVLALQEAGRGGVGAFEVQAAALGELLVLAAARRPEDEPRGARAVAELRNMAQRGALPPTLWACALLQRATTLLVVPQAEDRRAEVAALLEEQATVAGGERARVEGLALRGLLLQAQERPDEALQMFDEASKAFGALGLALDQAHTMGAFADLLQARGQLDEALRIRREEVLPVFERLGDVYAKATTLSMIADVHQTRGQLDEALRIRQEEVLPVYERLGDLRSQAITLGKIADVLEARGQLDEALRIHREEVLPVFERLGDVHAKATTLSMIADVHQTRGQLDEALRIRSGEVLPVYERLGDVRSKAVTLGKIADVHQARGQLDEALRIRQEEELPVYERLGDVHAKANSMLNITDVLRARGQLDEAHRLLREEALPIFERLGDVLGKANTMGRIAAVHEARGQLDEALTIRSEETLPVYERLNRRRDLAVEQANVATLLLLSRDRKRRDEARDLLTAALKSAVDLKLPAETEYVRGVFRRFSLAPAGAPSEPWPPKRRLIVLSAGVGAVLLLWILGGPKVALWFSAALAVGVVVFFAWSSRSGEG
jgi:tetratricopeptide (TPR) repeat protein